MIKKRQHGQYFTKGNPFIYKPFIDWFNNALLNSKNNIIIEPFSGSNCIPLLIRDLNLNNSTVKWDCFDIDPESNEKNVTDIPIKIQDVLESFPSNYDIGITNPPYLAKNSATRRNIAYKYDKYDDIYKFCIEKMLDNLKYVAVIIPESFIVQKIFHERLDTVISLKEKMFEDTECPVCLALFTPSVNNDFKIYLNNEFIGNYQDLKILDDLKNEKKYDMKFNDPYGEIGVIAIDNHINDSILFLQGEDINPEKIKYTSRSITKIKLSDNFTKSQIQDIIFISNNILKENRKNTRDVFLTAFKGIRKDGSYRRRISFNQIRSILNTAISSVK